MCPCVSLPVVAAHKPTRPTDSTDSAQLENTKNSRDLAEMLVGDFLKAMQYLDKDHRETEELVKKARYMYPKTFILLIKSHDLTRTHTPPNPTASSRRRRRPS